MEIRWNDADRLLSIGLKEEIDHHIAEKVRRKVDYEIQRCIPKKVVFDFSCVNFMDSAGIGMIIGRYKLSTMYGATLEIINVCSQVHRILDMSGVSKLVNIYSIEEELNHA